MSEENQPVSAIETTTSAPGFLRVCWGIIARPRHTFEQLRANGRRTWLIMALLALVLVVLPAVASGPIQAQQAQEAFQAAQEQFSNAQTGNAPPGEVVLGEGGEVPAFISSPLFTTVFPALGSIFGLVIGWVLWGGVLHLLSSLSSRFGRS